jgi:hypothetical protein
MTRQFIIKESFTYLLIVLFAYTAIQKVMEPWPFEYVLNQIPVIGTVAGTLTWMIPASELVIATLLVFPSRRKLGYMFSCILMSCFTLYVGGMLALSSHLPCSCGGVLQLLSWPQHLVLNLLLTLGSFWAWRTTSKDIVQGSLQAT